MATGLKNLKVRDCRGVDSRYANDIRSCVDPTYFAGHSASIHVKVAGKHHVIGSFGIMHPSVLKHFELP